MHLAASAIVTSSAIHSLAVHFSRRLSILLRGQYSTPTAIVLPFCPSYPSFVYTARASLDTVEQPSSCRLLSTANRLLYVVTSARLFLRNLVGRTRHG